MGPTPRLWKLVPCPTADFGDCELICSMIGGAYCRRPYRTATGVPGEEKASPEVRNLLCEPGGSARPLGICPLKFCVFLPLTGRWYGRGPKNSSCRLILAVLAIPGWPPKRCSIPRASQLARVLSGQVA